MATPEISVQEVKKLLDKGEDVYLLDVREPSELQYSKLEGAENVPMGQVPQRVEEMDPEKRTVVICRSGARSGEITDYLLGKGFKRVENMEGGMNEWARSVDPSQRTY
ncbi:MAG: rhodanese-like domain-containing protein [Fimbriimonadaceae bacterium]